MERWSHQSKWAAVIVGWPVPSIPSSHLHHPSPFFPLSLRDSSSSYHSLSTPPHSFLCVSPILASFNLRIMKWYFSVGIFAVISASSTAAQYFRIFFITLFLKTRFTKIPLPPLQELAAVSGYFCFLKLIGKHINLTFYYIQNLTKTAAGFFTNFALVSK